MSYAEGNSGTSRGGRASRPALTDFDRDAEMRLVACVTKPGVTVADIQGLPPASDITDEISERIYAAALEVIAERGRFDASLVSNRLRVSGTEPDSVYMLALKQTSAHLKYIHDYAKIVHDLAVVRQVKELGMLLIETATRHPGNASELLSEMDTAVMATHRTAAVGGGASDLVSFSDAIEEAWADITHPGTERFISTGIPALDYAIGGLVPGELITVAGTPGSGKTSLALGFGVYAAVECEERSLIVSKEMTAKQLARRAILAEAGVNGATVRRAGQHPEKYGLSPEEMNNLRAAKTKLSNMRGQDGTPRIMIVPPIHVSADSICAMIRREHLTRGLSLFIVDYLQILDQDERRGGSESNQEQKIAQDAQKFKDIALECNLAGVILSQLVKTTSAGRPATKDGTEVPPRLGDLKGSGGIAAASDTVIILHRLTPADEVIDADSAAYALPVKVDAIIAKGRFSGAGKVPLNFEAQYTRFSERNSDTDTQEGSERF